MRKNPFLSLFAASLIVMLPAQALAQTTPAPEELTQPRENAVSVRDRARPELDPLGVRLGGFDLNASIDFGIASTDNLFASESGTEEDDLIFNVSPYARLSSHWNRHALSFEAGGSSVTHEDFDNEDYETYFLGAQGRLDVGRSSNLSARARASHEVEPRTDPDTPSIGNPVEFDRTEFAVGGFHDFGRFNASVELSTREKDFEDAQNFRDSDENRIRGRVMTDLTPRIGLILEAAADERDYDNSPALDSESQTYLAGLSFRGDLVRGEFSVGHFERDYDSPAINDLDGLAVAGNVEWYVTQLTTISVDARRDANNDVSGTNGLPYITTAVGVAIDHELLRNVILGAGASVGERDYDTVDRTDDIRSANVRAEYILNRRAAIRAEFEHITVDSSGALAGREYDANTLSLGISFRL